MDVFLRTTLDRISARGQNPPKSPNFSLFFLVVPPIGNHVLALVKVVPPWWNRSHVGRDVGELAVLIHCWLGLPGEPNGWNLSVSEFAVNVIGDLLLHLLVVDVRSGVGGGRASLARLGRTSASRAHPVSFLPQQRQPLAANLYFLPLAAAPLFPIFPHLYFLPLAAPLFST